MYYVCVCVRACVQTCMRVRYVCVHACHVCASYLRNVLQRPFQLLVATDVQNVRKNTMDNADWHYPQLI